jgi:histidinol-phosphate aminotransferase
LKARGVLVKNVSKMHPSLHNCLRLTVGTPTENAHNCWRHYKESL